MHGGEPYGAVPIPLCEKHAANLYNWSTQTYRAFPIGQMEEQGLISNHLPGHTYIIQLPNGRIKIGMTREGRVLDRWREITRSYFKKGYREPIKPLALLDGGVSREAALHNTFREARVNDEFGEQFTPTVDLITFAESAGIPEEHSHLVPAYGRWWKKYFHENKHLLPPTEAGEMEAQRMSADPWYFPAN